MAKYTYNYSKGEINEDALGFTAGEIEPMSGLVGRSWVYYNACSTTQRRWSHEGNVKRKFCS
jgi:hypothetical protein